MNWFRFKSCVKCGGDLVLDQGDWLCLQCGTYYYTGLYQRLQDPKDPSAQHSEPPPIQRATGAVPWGPNPSLNRSLTLEPEVNRTDGYPWQTDRVSNECRMVDPWVKT